MTVGVLALGVVCGWLCVPLVSSPVTALRFGAAASALALVGLEALAFTGRAGATSLWVGVGAGLVVRAALGALLAVHFDLNRS